ncbi:hypothetical protein [Paenibacillus terricola]|nr:hypothetical protein [Paenibacillus terricola]
MIVTCTSIGVYEHALTRGNKYKVINQENAKYRIKGDHGKRVWINQAYFDLGEVFVLQMMDWKFDDDILSWNIIEVTIVFNDGSSRWCNMTTPEKLVEHFKNPMTHPLGLFMDKLIIMKTLEKDDVEQTLRYLDSQGELEKATRPLNLEELDEDKDFA